MADFTGLPYDKWNLSQTNYLVFSLGGMLLKLEGSEYIFKRRRNTLKTSIKVAWGIYLTSAFIIIIIITIIIISFMQGI